MPGSRRAVSTARDSESMGPATRSMRAGAGDGLGRFVGVGDPGGGWVPLGTAEALGEAGLPAAAKTASAGQPALPVPNWRSPASPRPGRM